MAAIGGRVELLLNRLHDQATSPHLEAAHRAVVEASQMIRHIHNFVSGDREGGVVMVDVNQLVTDSVQIARSTWFQGFRQRRDPVDLATDLHPVPAVPARASDLRIILLCLLRHAMDTLRPGGRLIVRTSSMGGDEDQMVVVSLSDDPSQPSTAEREDEVELSRGQVHTPESRLALAVVQAMIRDLDGRITVRPSATGGTTTALVFAVNRAVAGER
jgi:C4-dicarboxylate-specific signal transduction histidine kinase